MIAGRQEEAAGAGGGAAGLKRRHGQGQAKAEAEAERNQPMGGKARRCIRIDDVAAEEQHKEQSSTSSSSSTSLLARLSDDLLWRVLHLAGAWASGRALCRGAQAVADARVESVAVNPRTPAPILRALLPRLRGVKALDLTGVAAVDDAFLRWLVLEACPGLQRLGVSYCAQLTPVSTPLLGCVPSVALRGCWRLLRPCPTLPSEAVLELQLLALQQNDASRHDGVAKHYEFASPANRGVTEDGAAVGLRAFTAVVYERLSPMLGCQSFSVRQLSYDSPDRACFLVRTQGGGVGSNGVTAHATQHYLWLLSRQAAGQLQGCWMTDAIISAEHGLLSFLNLPEDAVAASSSSSGSNGGDNEDGLMMAAAAAAAAAASSSSTGH